MAIAILAIAKKFTNERWAHSYNKENEKEKKNGIANLKSKTVSNFFFFLFPLKYEAYWTNN